MKRSGKFAISFTLFTALMTAVWAFAFPGHIYFCTDDTGLPIDYLFPGQWIHGEIETVDQVSLNRDMPQPDAIKAGWTLEKIWAAWILMFGTSVVGSLIVAKHTSRRNDAFED